MNTTEIPRPELARHIEGWRQLFRGFMLATIREGKVPMVSTLLQPAVTIETNGIKQSISVECIPVFKDPTVNLPESLVVVFKSIHDPSQSALAAGQVRWAGAIPIPRRFQYGENKLLGLSDDTMIEVITQLGKSLEDPAINNK
jgi:hypothetical protein